MPAIEIGGHKVVYDDRGSGPVVILMHGLLMDRSMWDHAAEALSDSYRVITPDAPGHGESETVEVGYTFDDHAIDTWSFCDALGISSAVFGGQSMGGFTALRNALQRPDKARGLVLIDSSAREENAETLPQYEAFLQIALSDGVNEDLANVLFLVLFSAGFAATAEGEAWKKKLMALDAPRIHTMSRAVLDRPPILARLDEIRCPAVVIHGEEDIAISLDRAEQTAAGLKTSVIRVPGAGHASPVESPEIVTRAIRGFLDSLT
jgi:pimeloyl-ACP methyl ester carboxylesterase